jgi:hypothetical protein
VWRKDVSVPFKTRGSINSQGYFTASYKAKQFRVHNMVAELFIGEKPTDDHTIDHIDRNPRNNVVENLRWASKVEQARNRTTVKSLEVYNYLTGEIIGAYESQNDICEAFQVQPSIVSAATRFGIEHVDRGRQLGPHKYLSVRHSDLSNHIKLKRELDILEYEINVLKTDKNKRKSNPENLPPHITKTQSTYVLNITFRGEKFRKCGNDPKVLMSKKEEWINQKRQHYTDIYNKIML